MRRTHSFLYITKIQSETKVRWSQGAVKVRDRDLALCRKVRYMVKEMGRNNDEHSSAGAWRPYTQRTG